MAGLLALLQQILITACAAAAVVAGFKIYARWNRGEEVTAAIFSWLVGMLSVGVLVYAIRTYILGGGILGGMAIGWAGLLNYEIYEFAIIAGVIVSIVSLIRIYTKYTDGEDIVPMVYQWIGSLLFLSVMGMIIGALMP